MTAFLSAPVYAPRADFARTDPAAVALLPERWARRYRVIPLYRDKGVLVVATSDPLDLDAERAIAFATGHRIRWVQASSAEITLQMARWYPEASRIDAAPAPVDVQHISFEAASGANVYPDDAASAIRLVDQLLAEGIHAGASDIHIEPEEQGIAVRHRVDGVLRHVRVLARSIAPSLVSRVKILSGLDIADRMRPQDGRARVAVRGAVVDLRVSTLPASHGEKIVIRVLDGSAGLRTLDAIGFTDGDLARIRTLLEQREGLVLVTGPTGSGKTTTLYAALREVQARGVNVVTVEDPIEYRLPGIVQVQVHERAGLTFESALRSIMRQDPDVILVGEIRDRETAEIAIQAALTGHLVFSTLHTNDATSAIARLIDIGAASYQIATAVKGVIAQRLVRRLCRACAGSGCAECIGIGYRGRCAVAEILVGSPEFERRVAAGAAPESIAEAARTNGCMSLWESGLALVARGETTIEELRRVAAAPALTVSEPRPSSAEVPRIESRGVTLPVGELSLGELSLGELPSSEAPVGEPPVGQLPLDELPVEEPPRVVRIGWWSARPAAVGGGARNQLISAAAALDERVEVVILDSPAGSHSPPLDAIVTLGAPSSTAHADREHSTSGAPSAAAPLIVTLADSAAPSDHVRSLAYDAHLVLPTHTHGRVILSIVLALLRWRSG